jgi:MOSC domain-containing protein YiiM
VGDQLRAGSAILEITKPRGPCATLDVYGAQLKFDIRTKDPASPVWGLSGFYARVLSPGIVRPEDIIEVVAVSA